MYVSIDSNLVVNCLDKVSARADCEVDVTGMHQRRGRSIGTRRSKEASDTESGPHQVRDEDARAHGNGHLRFLSALFGALDAGDQDESCGLGTAGTDDEGDGTAAGARRDALPRLLRQKALPLVRGRAFMRIKSVRLFTIRRE